ncbi:hypothetical protein SKAU_G00114490 [Synaphobranchus kaupii]|uniref:Uncharacterized protein n=1 Tax=Synaphobranchus kaupii TaxID=118154 RepID=A0A9Q1G284_SYNKA|nr:hypothetical protein SKAU_G00114490 [Synaphobranchus kaupii]
MQKVKDTEDKVFSSRLSLPCECQQVETTLESPGLRALKEQEKYRRGRPSKVTTILVNCFIPAGGRGRDRCERLCALFPPPPPPASGRGTGGVRSSV